MYKSLTLPQGMLYCCPAGETAAEQHAAAHALLAESVRQYTGKPAPLRMECTPMGKPFFPDMPSLHFNLSHCRGLAVCLLSSSVCGVDAEQRRPLRERVVHRVFSEEEQQALVAADDPDLLFTQLWTLKEAYVKAKGIGISYPMREVSFALTPDGIRSNREDAVFRQFAEGEHIISACFLRDRMP